MQKRSYSTQFHPVPISSGHTLYYDTTPFALPCSEEISKLHYHDKYEIGICTEGEGIFLCEGIYFSLSVGDVIFIPPNKRHYSRSLTCDAPCRCFFVHVSPEYVDSLLLAAVECEQNVSNILDTAEALVPSVLHASVYPKATASLSRLVTECHDGVINLSMLCGVRLLDFLLDVPNLFSSRVYATQTECRSDDVVLSVAEHLALHYDASDTLEDLCRLCHLSKSQLLRRFHSVFGISPIAYRNRFRTRIAAELLTHTKLSVGEISSRAGYSDVSDFYRSFKKHYGIAPSLYRDAVRNDASASAF